MPGLCGLDNTSEMKSVEFFHSVSEGLRLLKQDGASTTADDNGAINIWQGDDGMYRGDRMVNCMSESTVKVKTLTALKVWLKEEMPKIR